VSFEAQYEGRCPAGDAIEPGDEIEYFDDQVVHTDCLAFVRSRARRDEKTREVCTTCWLLKPCECDDERKTA
jgi:hypothetical protein